MIREPARVRPRSPAGDVLVCPYTNPAWTPLFQRAAAVVVDSGGPRSHAAIVAREYGIPAVMGTGNGTTALTDGRWSPSTAVAAGSSQPSRPRSRRDRPPQPAAAAGRRAQLGDLPGALDELGEVGYARLRMERIAERAGASKASLYRRWPSRMELALDAIHHLAPDPGSAPDTGSLRGDLLAWLRLSAGLLLGPAGEALRGVLGDALSDPERTRNCAGAPAAPGGWRRTRSPGEPWRGARSTPRR